MLTQRPSTLDPLLGVFTGVLAYRLYEGHPRTAPPPGQTLSELVQWKWNKRKAEREEQEQSAEF